MSLVSGQAAATLSAPSVLGRMAERVAMIGIAATFLLIAYSKMGDRADDAVAQSNLAAILPVVHAYAVEHGGYTGMTLETLDEEYGADVELGTYAIVDRGASDFCIETVHAGRAWHVSASRNEPWPGSCAA